MSGLRRQLLTLACALLGAAPLISRSLSQQANQALAAGAPVLPWLLPPVRLLLTAAAATCGASRLPTRSLLRLPCLQPCLACSTKWLTFFGRSGTACLPPLHPLRSWAPDAWRWCAACRSRCMCPSEQRVGQGIAEGLLTACTQAEQLAIDTKSGHFWLHDSTVRAITHCFTLLAAMDFAQPTLDDMRRARESGRAAALAKHCGAAVAGQGRVGAHGMLPALLPAASRPRATF